MSEYAVGRPDEAHKTYVIVGYLGLAFGFVLMGVPSLVAVIIAYVKRGGAPEPLAGHYRSIIRTFWIGVALAAAGYLALAASFPALSLALDRSQGLQTAAAVAGTVLPVAATVLMAAAVLIPLIVSIVGLVRANAEKPVGGEA